jgi:DNA-binding MurR/RpiR family transcriptional regulator
MVAGYKLSTSLAMYFGYLLKKIKSDVVIDTVYSGANLDSIALSRKDMLLFVIAFPRYPRQAIELAEYAKSYGTQIVCLTDSMKCPVVSYSDTYVIIDIEGHSFVDPFSHIVTFLGAVIHEIAQIDKPSTTERLSRIEEGVHRRRDFYLEEGTQWPPYSPLGSNR